jgi:hypothetical protein
MPKEECEAHWEANESVEHPNISLPHGWHLNCAKVAVPPPPEAGPKLDAEIRCRIQNLPDPMRYERMYQNPQFWYNFLTWEHTACHRSTFHGDQSWDAYPVEDFLPARKTTTMTTTSSRRRPTRPWRTPPRRAPGICPGVPGIRSSWLR